MDVTQLAKNTFNQCAEQYEAKFMDTGSFHETLDSFCNKIGRSDAAILEIACGPGNITQYLLRQRPGYNIIAIDVAEHMLALARKNNPTVQFMEMNARAIATFTQKLDGIMCGFGLPYLSKEEAVQLIADAAALLRNNGVLYLSTMENDYIRSGLQTSSTGSQLYIYYHEADYLLDALQRHGFSVVEVHRIPYTGDNGVTSTDLVLIAQK